tara:strand:+ start:31293 stop:32150 length:858 start_codon:yes stop_codon:yes gene_type:complete
MAETQAEKKRRLERLLFGGDSGTPASPPSSPPLSPPTGVGAAGAGAGGAGAGGVDTAGAGDDQEALVANTGVTPKPNLGESRVDPYEYEPETSEDTIEPHQPMPIEKASFGLLTDDDLSALALANVFPKGLEFEEREEGWSLPFGLSPERTSVEDQYKEIDSVLDRSNFLRKRRDQKREAIKHAKRQESVEPYLSKATRYAPWSMITAQSPSLAPVGIELYEAARHYGPKAWEKVQAFKERLDRLEETESRLVKSEEERAESQAEIKELRKRLDRFLETAELPAE